jgi:hypothetical protein
LQSGSNARATNAGILNIVVQTFTDGLISIDSQGLSRRLIHLDDDVALIEQQRRFVEAVDYRRDAIITIARRGFSPHNDNSASAICSKRPLASHPARIPISCMLKRCGIYFMAVG